MKLAGGSGNAMSIIRKALVGDSKDLTELAIKSEAYWGYDSHYMEKFKVTYKVTEDFIKNNPIFVVEEDEIIVGFYGITSEKNQVSLEYLYVEPRSIGKGYGKILWDHMIRNC